MDTDAIRILLVEDNPGDVRIVREMLSDAWPSRFDVLHADRVGEALAMLENESLDAILLDLSLPDAMGLDTVKRMIEASPCVAVIVMSGTNSEDVAIMAVQEGAQDYLVKGNVDTGLLVRSIRYSIERKRIEEALKESEGKYRTLIETANDAIVIADHESGIIIEANRKAEELFGIPASEIVGLHISQMHPEEMADEISEHFRKGLRDVDDLLELIAVRKDGSRFPVEVSENVLTLQGRHVRLGILRDITARKLAEEALRRERDRAQRYLDIAKVILLAIDAEERVSLINRKGVEILGYTEEEILGRNWFDDFVHLEFKKEARSNFRALISNANEKLEAFENVIVTRDGLERRIAWNITVLMDEHGIIQGALSSGEDITERRRAERILHHQAFFDSLTNLPNRVLFSDRLMQAYERSKRNSDYLFGMIFLDIDRFKIVNDSLGHVLGDQLLKYMGQRLLACTRTGDTVSRLGGDEFAILLDNINDINEATRVAERIQKELEAPFNLDGHEIFVSASMGLAFNSKEYMAHQELMRDADTAMYRAKGRGRGCYEIFDEDMHENVMCLMRMEADLRRALRHDEFSMFYQPIVCLADERIIGVEALLRWRHPRRGLVLPQDFIPLAEETGLISPISEFVLREAVSQCRKWVEKGLRDFFVAVNCSVRQFQQQDLEGLVRELLQENGVSPKMLELEITESIAMDEKATDILNGLSEIGINISIDDFGTGYSSLSQLKSFPINTLKIDMSFIKDINTDPDALEITSAIIAMAEKLNLHVVAEGVDDPEKLELLKSLNCDAAQGHFYSKPMPAESVEKLLMDRYPWNTAAKKTNVE